MSAFLESSTPPQYVERSAGSRFRVSSFFYETLAIGLIYFVLARAGQVLAITPGNVTPVWPASGFALVVALHYGPRVWLGLWLGNFVGNTWAFLDTSTASNAVRTILTGLAIGPGDLLQALGGAFLLRQFCPSNIRFSSIREVLWFTGTQLIACLSSASFGVLMLCVGGIIPISACSYTWLTWYLGDSVGIFTVAPLFMTWPMAARLVESRRRAIETVLTVATGIMVAIYVFSDTIAIQLASVATAVVLWAAIRGNQFAVATNVLVTATIAIWGTSLGLGPFASEDMNIAILSLQVFVATSIVTGLSMAAALEEREHSTRQLNSEIERNRETEQELAAAAQIQRTLLPQKVPRVAGLDIAGSCVPATSAAADFFDFFRLKDGRLGIVVGDVSGHGVGPALIMASTRQALRSNKIYHGDIGDLLTAVNSNLSEGDGIARYVTVFLAAIDEHARSLQWSSAGHVSMLLTATGKFVDLPALSFPLGMTLDEAGPARKIPSSERIPFEPGSILILLTDGLIEAQDISGKLYGKHRLRDEILRHQNRTADEIVNGLLDAITAYCAPNAPQDDMTIVVVRSMPVV